MYSCSAFANIGLNVPLLVAHVLRAEYFIESDDTFWLYGLINNFEIIKLPTNTKEDKRYKSRFISSKFAKQHAFEKAALAFTKMINAQLWD